MRYFLLSFLLFSISLNSFSQLYPDLDMYCSDIQKELDASSSEVRFFTPYEEPIYFKKLVSNGKEAYIMTINVIGPAENTGKGVIVNLGRNYTIKKEDVVTQVYQNEEGQYVHYASFTLTKDDISKLKNYIIKNYQVYMYSSGDASNNVKYQGYMYCLTKK